MEYGDPRLPDRYWSKVYPCPITGCWLWGAARHDGSFHYGIWNAYGKSKTSRAHVSAFFAAGGVLTEERPVVRHRCDQPPCVNPAHLEPGSHGENMADMVCRGRYRHGRSAKIDLEIARQIRTRCASGETQRAVAADLGLVQSAVSMIVNGLRWKE